MNILKYQNKNRSIQLTKYAQDLYMENDKTQ